MLVVLLQGVNATLQLMVTSGCDLTVELRTRFVTSHPVAVLLGHSATVLDVAIYQAASRANPQRLWRHWESTR